jgi:hypothetical protein
LDLPSFNLGLLGLFNIYRRELKAVIAVQEKVVECDWGDNCRWLAEAVKSRMNPTMIVGK